MRTTLDIDTDVLAAAKELARQQNVSAGQVVSQLLRRVLTGQAENSTISPDRFGVSICCRVSSFSSGQGRYHE